MQKLAVPGANRLQYTYSLVIALDENFERVQRNTIVGSIDFGVQFCSTQVYLYKCICLYLYQGVQ